MGRKKSAKYELYSALGDAMRMASEYDGIVMPDGLETLMNAGTKIVGADKAIELTVVAKKNGSAEDACDLLDKYLNQF